jgi:hypothetical protein
MCFEEMKGIEKMFNGIKYKYLYSLGNKTVLDLFEASSAHSLSLA